MRDNKPEQGQRTESKIVSNTETCDVIEDIAKYIESASKISSSSSSDGRKNDTHGQADAGKTFMEYATIELKDHHLKRSDSDSKIIAHWSNGIDSITLHSADYSVPSSNNAQPISNIAESYATTSSNVTQSVIQSSATINNRQSVVASRPIIEIDSINTTDNKQVGESSNQQAGLTKEKTPDAPPVDNGSSSSRLVVSNLFKRIKRIKNVKLYFVRI